jgi:hypothetical protein
MYFENIFFIVLTRIMGISGETTSSLPSCLPLYMSIGPSGRLQLQKIEAIIALMRGFLTAHMLIHLINYQSCSYKLLL